MQAYNSANSQLETGAGQFAVSGSGDLFYLTGSVLQGARNALVWLDRTGRATAVSVDAGPYSGPRLSRDRGRAVLFAMTTDDRRPFVVDFSRQQLSRLKFDGDVWWPVWSPDGDRIAFAGVVDGAYQLYTMRADGSAPAEPLTPPSANAMPACWSSDGQELLFIDRIENKYDIFRLRMRDRGVEPVTETPGANTARVMSVGVITGDKFTATSPRLLFETPVSEFGGGNPFRGYDVTPDGERILDFTLRLPEQPPPSAINVIVNWIEEVRARLGGAQVTAGSSHTVV